MAVSVFLLLLLLCYPELVLARPNIRTNKNTARGARKSLYRLLNDLIN
jgi:hypothetical protein